MSRPDERFLVVTDHGRVLVVVRGDKGALEPDLLDVRRHDDAAAAGVALETPLRAFAAKMVDLLVARGTDELPMSPAMRDIDAEGEGGGGPAPHRAGGAGVDRRRVSR